MNRAVIVYDDECGFCKWCVRKAVNEGEFDVIGFNEITEEIAHRLPDEYEDCVHLVTLNNVYSCGEAVEQALLRTRSPPQVALYYGKRIPGYKSIRDTSYRFVADNRGWFGRIRSCDDI